MQRKDLLDTIEEVGYKNKDGKHVKGSPAVVHFVYKYKRFLHTSYSSIDPRQIVRGENFVTKLLAS